MCQRLCIADVDCWDKAEQVAYTKISVGFSVVPNRSPGTVRVDP